MKKWLFIMLLFSFSILVTACSSNGENSESSDEGAVSKEQVAEQKSDTTNTEAKKKLIGEQKEEQVKENNTAEQGNISQTNRKVIYNASLRIEVKDFQQALDDIQTLVADRSGYIVESNTYGDAEGDITEGQVTARIPQEQFREFMDLVEEGSSNVMERSISGQDVTEEYIDLESRLKSKRVVEKRLLSFMEQAEKTEDLLTISDDLAKVQQEIEEITGRMNYLQNKADLATVTIHIQENSVSISGINEGELNTWEQTKQQFMKSINFLIFAFSGLFIFIVGNLPILIIVGAISLVAFLIYKRKKKKGNQEA